MERQHFVVLIDPAGRGRKTERPAYGEGVGQGERGEARRRSEQAGKQRVQGRRELPARVRGRAQGKRETGRTGRESRDPHPADSYNFNHQLATPPASTGRVICEKHVDPREEEGRAYSFISSYISCKRPVLPLTSAPMTPIRQEIKELSDARL
ncbi:hypothetical protein KM043_016440 [Ampulex compressa]|nr:hypothetical protein KM043_016440 [Ampulex compressa]